MIVKVAKNNLCECGFPVLDEKIPLGELAHSYGSTGGDWIAGRIRDEATRIEKGES